MKKSTITFFLLSLLLTSCGPSTKLVQSWTNKEETPKSFEKLAVVALTQKESSRYLMERAIVKDFTNDGIKAIATYEIFPLAGRIGDLSEIIKDPEDLKRRVREKVNAHNIDAIMIISIFNIETEQRYVNDHNYTMGGAGYYGSPYYGGMGYYGTPYMRGSYYNYYAYSVGTIYNQGYYVDDITYFLECNLYDVETEELLWTGRTKTVNMESVEEEVVYFSEIVINDLIKNNVIVP